MKNCLLICFVSMLAACSAPKYTYYFDHYDYNSGKKYPNETQVKSSVTSNPEPFQLKEESLVASAEATPIVLRKNGITEEVNKNTESKSADIEGIKPADKLDKETFAKRYKSMTKKQRREFRKDLKNEVKNIIKGRKNSDGMPGESVEALDYDLKMAIIFGAVGLTLNLFGAFNTVFWVLGVIAIVIGVVFFIKWLVRQ